MALVKTILKNTSIEVIAKFTGSGTDTITLDSLISTGQTTQAPINVSITGVSVSTLATGSAKVTRNAVDVLSLSGNYDFNPASANYAVLKEQAASDITVNLTTEGTLILKLKKDTGYSAPFANTNQP